MEEMIDSSVEHFNELLSKHRLSDAQNQLIRDIRRRGKNKQAAQNCRKRKLEVIQTVEDEVSDTWFSYDNTALCTGPGSDPGQVIHSHVLLLPSSIIWYWHKL